MQQGHLKILEVFDYFNNRNDPRILDPDFLQRYTSSILPPSSKNRLKEPDRLSQSGSGYSQPQTPNPTNLPINTNNLIQQLYP
jgi:hypothetical protein